MQTEGRKMTIFLKTQVAFLLLTLSVTSFSQVKNHGTECLIVEMANWDGVPQLTITDTLKPDSFCKGPLDLVIPSGVTHIARAFFGVPVRSIKFNKEIRVIGGESFRGFDRRQILKELNLPNTIEKVSHNAFGSGSIRKLTLPAKNIQFGSWAFWSNRIEDLKISGKQKIISVGLFSENKISKLELQEGIQIIEEDAFAYNELKTLRIPRSVKSIGPGAFAENNKLKYVYMYSGTKFFDGTTDDPTFPENVKIVFLD